MNEETFLDGPPSLVSILFEVKHRVMSAYGIFGYVALGVTVLYQVARVAAEQASTSAFDFGHRVGMAHALHDPEGAIAALDGDGDEREAHERSEPEDDIESIVYGGAVVARDGNDSRHASSQKPMEPT